MTHVTSFARDAASDSVRVGPNSRTASAATSRSRAFVYSAGAGLLLDRRACGSALCPAAADLPVAVRAPVAGADLKAPVGPVLSKPCCRCGPTRGLQGLVPERLRRCPDAGDKAPAGLLTADFSTDRCRRAQQVKFLLRSAAAATANAQCASSSRRLSAVTTLEASHALCYPGTL